MSFWVYMLRCADGSFYTGQTDNLERRIGQHHMGAVPGYTHNRRPVWLVFSQELETRDEAIAAERQLKGWGRAKKEALTHGDWRRIQQLAWGSNHPLPERLSRAVRPSIPQGERDSLKTRRPTAERKESQ